MTAPLLVFKRQAWIDVAATLRAIADDVESDCGARMAVLVMVREDNSLAVYGLGPESNCDLRITGLLNVGAHLMAEGYMV